MKRHTRIAVVILAILVAIGGLRLLARRLPVNLDGPEYRSILECAENQEKLYQSIEWELQKNGKLPGQDFQIDGFRANDVWKCPACGKGYVLHLKNYGNPDAALITDEREIHPTKFMWWFRGLNPRVQTMGDGTIQLFKGGKLQTMGGG